jgi:predicted amidohydrolase YtcJ
MTQKAAPSGFILLGVREGTITPGKLADMVVLTGDPTQLPPDEIRDLNVEMAILGGEWLGKGIINQ